MRKREIIRKLLPVRDGVNPDSVIREIEAAHRKYLQTKDYKIGGISLWGRTLVLAPKLHDQAGRPELKALLRYMAKLRAIYRTATGRKIGRMFNSYTGKEEPHPFIRACLEATHVEYSAWTDVRLSRRK